MNYPHQLKLSLALFLLVSLRPAYGAEEIRDPALDSVLEKVGMDYGIDLHYAEGPTVKFNNLDYSLAGIEDKQALTNVVLLFSQEIKLYPKNFFRLAHCRGIYFVQKLFYQQKPAEGIFFEKINYIFYDYARCGTNAPIIRHSIHHEIYHMMGSKHPFWKEHGSAWEKLNRPGFTYNPKHGPHERNPINYSAPFEPGFITDYAMASAEEDRAEVFACLMIPEQLSLMEQWAQKDKILFQKIEMMKEFLKEFFKESGIFDN